MSIAWCGIYDDLNTKFQASTYSSNYLRAPYHNFFPKVAKTFSLSYISLIIFTEEDSFLHNHLMLFPVSETHFFTLNALGVNFWNYLVFGNDFFRWSEGSWKLSEFLYIFGILWYVHLCPIGFYSQIILLNWCRVALAFITTKSWFLCSSVWSKNPFSAYFFETFHHWYRRFNSHYHANSRS